jgi:hypothetical protein
MTTTARPRVSRAEWLLWCGVVLGLALAVASLSRRPRASALPAHAVAVVNGQVILSSDYDVELRAVLDGQVRPATDLEKKEAVERLVEEELRVEHGLSLDLPRRDPAARRALLTAVFDAERSAEGAREPSEQELARFYTATIEGLRKTATIRVAEHLP